MAYSIRSCAIEIFLAAFALSSLACSTQGYSGAPLPEGEISNIAIHSYGEVTLEHERVDGRGFSYFSSSMDVPAGDHRFQVNYRTETESCYSDDSYCDVSIATGLCEGTVQTKAGRNYLVTVSEHYSSVSVNVSAKSYLDFTERDDEPNPGDGNCQEISSYDTIKRKKD